MFSQVLFIKPRLSCVKEAEKLFPGKEEERDKAIKNRQNKVKEERDEKKKEDGRRKLLFVDQCSMGMMSLSSQSDEEGRRRKRGRNKRELERSDYNKKLHRGQKGVTSCCCRHILAS